MKEWRKIRAGEWGLDEGSALEPIKLILRGGYWRIVMPKWLCGYEASLATGCRSLAAAKKAFERWEQHRPGDS